MISLLKPSSGSQSAGLTSPATNKEGHRLSIGARMGIGVNNSTMEVYSPPLTARPEAVDPTSPVLQLNGEDHAQHGGILIHTDTPAVSHGRSKSQDLDPDTHLSSPMPLQTAMLPISPALSASVQLINNASEKIPADQLPSTVRPGVPARAPSKIRFAPLPNPRRQRSMSTGRNIAVKATMEPDGTRTLQRHAKRDNEDEGFYQDQDSGTSMRYLDEQAVDDEEDDEVDEDEDEGGDGRGKRSSWKAMGMGHWKPGSFSSGSYTKKLLGPLLNPATTGTGTGTGTGGNQGGDAELERLTSRESGRRISADIAMPASQSLRKTFSTTSGFIGSSPFRTAGEHERKRNFFPSSSLSGASSGGGGGQTSASGAALGLLGIGEKRGKQAHRASNTPDFSSLSASMGRQADTEFAPEGLDVTTSPRPVKMLNGRVYGKNRQTQQAPVGKPVEPEFVEWGGMMGSKGGGLGTVASATTTTIPSSSTGSMGSVGRASGNDEEDDGSGISWVKKRREARERERRASELSPSEEITNAGLYAGSLPTSSEMQKNWQRGGAGPMDTAAHLPAVSEDRVATPIDAEHFAFNNSTANQQRQELGGGMAEQSPWINEDLSPLARMQAQDERHAQDDPGHIVQAVQIPASPMQAVQWRQSFPAEGDDGGSTGPGGVLPLQSLEDEYEEEEGVDGDFESDDEEELAAEEIKKRSTSSAAGVEVVSRHRD